MPESYPDILRRAAGKIRFDWEGANAGDGNEGHTLSLLAPLMDEAADRLEEHLPHWTGERWASEAAIDVPPPPGWNKPEFVERTVQHHYGAGLAVARAYLGESA